VLAHELTHVQEFRERAGSDAACHGISSRAVPYVDGDRYAKDTARIRPCSSSSLAMTRSGDEAFPLASAEQDPRFGSSARSPAVVVEFLRSA